METTTNQEAQMSTSQTIAQYNLYAIQAETAAKAAEHQQGRGCQEGQELRQEAQDWRERAWELSHS